MLSVTNCLQARGFRIYVIINPWILHCGMRETNPRCVSCKYSLLPQRAHNSMITSLWYPNATATSFPRYKDVIIASCACWLQLMYLYKFVSQETWNELIPLSIPLSIYFLCVYNRILLWTTPTNPCTLSQRSANIDPVVTIDIGPRLGSPM